MIRQRIPIQWDQGVDTSGGGAPTTPQFVSLWNTENLGGTGSPTRQVDLPMSAGPEVDWGDGTIDNLNTHTYVAGGIYEITIDETNTDFRFANVGDKWKIVDVTQCNGLNVTNTNVFERCVNMTWSSTDAPNIQTTNLGAMFFGCEVLNGTGSFSTWDVSAVTSVVNMFFGAFDFIGTGLEDWDVGSCSNFNQMFYACRDFAAPVGIWNMSNATNIGGMFRACTNFNIDVSAWDVSNCATFDHCFNGTSFTHDLNNWDMSKAVTIHAMFGSSQYNGDITGWTFTSALRDTSWVFAGNTAFNRDISSWNVASVTNMSNMFGSASSFDQDLTGWIIGNVTNMSTMLDNCGMSQANYDAFLTMCDGQTVQPNITLGANGLSYTAAGAGGTARTSLATSDLWSFLGDIAA